MAQYNLEHVVKMDEVGKEIGFTCYDADGAVVNLTNYTVTMNIYQGSTAVISGASVTKRTQTGATIGQCYHTWTANTIPDAAGKYRLELKLVYGSNVLYFPCDRNKERTYATLIVQEALG